MIKKFEIRFLEEAMDFLEDLPEKPRDKIIYNINKAARTNDKKLFKKLTGEIWEFRTLYLSTHYRLFAFWDKSDKTDTLVIVTHGLIKKTNKVSKSEILRAKQIMNKYINKQS